MKVCPECEGEFEDNATVCDACNVELIGAEEAARRRATSPSPLPDGAGFVPLITCDDPFDAEAYVAALQEARIPVFSRGRRRSVVDVLVTPGASSFWELFVPADKIDAARQAVDARRALLEREQEAAARAAEEEEAETEGHEVVGESESETVASAWAARLAAAGISAVLRSRNDVELDPADPGDPPMTLVLVPRDQVEKARALLSQGF